MAAPDAARPQDDTSAASARDVKRSVRNAFKLGGSLLVTWGIALAVKFPLRRYLGPEVMGPVNFADAYTAAFFVFLSLGVDTYVRKVIPVTPRHLSDFLGGIFAVRLVMTAAIFLVMTVLMRLAGQSAEVQLLVYVSGVAQLFITTNQTLSSALHSHSTVDGLSVLSVVSKCVWGAGIVLTIVLDTSIVGLPLSLLASEVLKAAGAFYLVRKNLQLKLTFSAAAVKGVVLASVPYYVHGVSHVIYNKLDISVLKFVSTDLEVGWYSAAADIAGITMLVAPMFGWVLMPLFARAAARSETEYFHLVRRTLELVFTVAIPMSLAIWVGADIWIHLLLGPKFAGAALSLRILAPLFLLSYVAIISAISLNLRDRPWTVTLISVGGLLANPVFIYLFLGPSRRFFGEAGAGAGCAIAQVCTEALVTLAMVAVVGSRAFDRRMAVMLVKTFGVAAVIILLDRALTGAGWGWGRLALEAALYVAAAVAIGAVRPVEMVRFARAAFSEGRRRETAGRSPR
ncbi:MAG: flippase [Myxococcaceae bacterium]